MKKVVVLLLTVATLVSCMAIYPSADDYGIEPYYNNVGRVGISFNITPSGLACVGVTYTGAEGLLREAKCEIYLEKRFLGLFWNRVDIGVTDDVWVDYLNSVTGNFYHEFQLSDTGTYRAVFKVTFYGNNGMNDVVDEQIDQKYS